MLLDLVIDADVMIQAANPGLGVHADSLTLLTKLRKGETALCVDDGFDPVEAKNTSLIHSQYRGGLPPQSYPLQVLTLLLATGRIKEVPRAPVAVKNRIRSLVPNNSPDRRYVEVAYASDSLLLASHDYGDFPDHVRQKINDEFSICIEDAAACHPLL